MPTRRNAKQKFTLRPETRVLIKQIFIGVGLFLLVGLLLYGIWYSTRLEQVTVSKVEVTGQQTVSEERLLHEINSILDENIVLGLVPNRFTLMYPKQQIASALKAVPRIAEAEIETSNRNLLSVRVVEYVPDALWCNYSKLDNCYFLNDEGVAFAASPRLTGGSFIRYVYQGKDPSSGASLIERQRLEDIDWLMFYLQELFNFYPILIALYEDDRVIYSSADGKQILITLRQEIDETLQYLEVFFGSEEFFHLRTESFEYIDARFGNRIFVKEFPVVEVDDVESGELGTTTITTATSSVPGDLTEDEE